MAQAKKKAATTKKKAAASKKKVVSEDFENDDDFGGSDDCANGNDFEYPEGIFGPLPDWIPVELAQDYESASYEVTCDYKGKDIAKLVEAHFKKVSDEFMNDPEAFIDFREEEPDLGALVMIKAMISSGPRYGFHVYLGWDKAKELERKKDSDRGKAARSKPRLPNRLNEEIRKIVELDPKVRWTRLEILLGKITDKDGRKVFTFDTEEISWKNENGKRRTATMTGLKDRLNEVRKKINSQ